ncbi:MAG: cytochrome c [Bryobacterales bacterium]|nr:cytochrome c [Bryobacterales bacterium]
MAQLRIDRVHSLTRLSLLALLLAGCGAPPRQVPPDVAPGRIHFQSYCAACHQYDGQGMGDAPSLANSPWVSGPRSRLIRIVLHGVRGTMVVDGKSYDREMPGFGQVLSDSDIASLLSYVRKQFSASSEPVTVEMVSRVRGANRGRALYWRVDELLALP